MHKEYLYIKTEETTLKVQNTSIEAVRKKTIEKNAVRLFDKHKIAIAGSLGKPDWNALEREAKGNFSLNLKYPYPLSKSTKDHRHYPLNPKMNDHALLDTSEKILAFLRKSFSGYRFSQSITRRKTTKQMWNTEDLDLFEESASLEIGLLLKDKSSADLFNGFIAYQGRDFNLERFIEFNTHMLTQFNKEVPLPKKKTLPVFTIQANELMAFLSRSLSAETMHSGSSILAGRLNEEVFNPKINLEINRNPKFHDVSFFDHEGSTLIEDRIPLVNHGVLKRVFADKASASKYDCSQTASAVGEYDCVPTLARRAPLRFQTDSTDIKKALNGEVAILVLMSAGGDFTGSGHFAAPVQVSVLFDGEKIIGKLPEFTMKSHLFRMLGPDYLGTFDADAFYFGDNAQIQGYTMTIEPH